MESLSFWLFVGVCVSGLALPFTNLLDPPSRRLRKLEEEAAEWEWIARSLRKDRDRLKLEQERLRRQQQQLRQLLDEIEAAHNARLDHGDRT
jgi:hypothetical protein